MSPKQWFLILLKDGGVDIVSEMFDKPEDAYDAYNKFGDKNGGTLNICETIYG